MKNRNIVFIVVILLLSSFFFSCKKYLDEKSNKSLVVLKSLDDLQALLDDDVTMNKNTPGFGEASADDYFVRLVDYNSSFSIRDRNTYTWRLDDYPFQNDWSQNYQAVYPVNYCLENIDKVERNVQNSGNWDNVKGSALFYRAFRFLNLVWEYGKAYDDNLSQNDNGIVLRLGSDFNVPSVRATVKESYERVINDAKLATQYLPNNPLHTMRPSKAAAYGLLARAFLSMRKYDSAFKYADLSLQIKSDLLDYNSSQVNPSSQTPFQPFNKEIIFYSSQSSNHWPKNPYVALIDTTLYNSYDSNDMRKSVFFYSNSGFQGFQGNYNAIEFYALFSGIATDEMYLIRAECNARKGDKDAAIEDLNTLMIKRWKNNGTWVSFAATDSNDALRKILAERRKELLMRGLRWIDIKRLNKEGANLTLKRVVDQVYILAPNNDKYALPLPKDILDVTGMQQNSGW